MRKSNFHKPASGHAAKGQDFHHKKSLGQNFLADVSLLDRLVELSGVTEDDEVLEIGTGLGSLTERLALRCKHVTTVEIDDTLIPVLKVTFEKYDNITLLHANALKLDFKKLTADMGRFRIVANIPYYLTTDLLTKLLKSDLNLKSISVMVQKEAADRITAVPGDDSYGILSVRTAWKGIAEQVLDVPAELFDPPPKVDSSFVNIIMREKQPVEEADSRIVMRAAESVFMNRRKTLANNLISGFHISKEEAEEVLDECGLKRTVRGEDLDIEQLARIAVKLAVYLPESGRKDVQESV